MPVIIHGRRGRIEAAVIKGASPLLLSRTTLKSLRAVLDFAENTVTLHGGEPHRFRSTKLDSSSSMS